MRHVNRRHFSHQKSAHRNPNSTLESMGICGRLRGNAYQLAEKYANLGRDLELQRETVRAESCRQYAEHYKRMDMALKLIQSKRQSVVKENPEKDNLATKSDTLDAQEHNPHAISQEEQDTFEAPSFRTTSDEDEQEKRSNNLPSFEQPADQSNTEQIKEESISPPVTVKTRKRRTKTTATSKTKKQAQSAEKKSEDSA